MNNKEFISALSRSLDVSLSEAQEYVNILNSSIVNLLNDKDTLSVKGFGSFEVKKSRGACSDQSVYAAKNARFSPNLHWYSNRGLTLRKQ